MSAAPAAVARPYAAAAFALAQEANAVENWQGALARAAQMARALRAVLASGKFVDEARQCEAILAAIPEASEAQQRFVRLLAENGRLPALPEIVKRFDVLRLASANILRVRVESAQPFTNKEKKAFDEFLSRRFGQTVESEYTLKKTLIGGVRVYARDDVLDASIRGRIERLRAALL